MAKTTHEIRDPVHTFIHMHTDERAIVDSAPVQRLRQIHQLALTYLLYPGATHKRFEHSLGVMDLAGRVFDVVTNRENIHPEIRESLPEVEDTENLPYWRRTLRMAALCHDLGHLPFSHATEDLLPLGWNHELISDRYITEYMKPHFESMTQPLKPDVISRIALGKKELKQKTFTPWEELLSEIITGDAFGVDRIDYLLRDSIHAGVAYGRFDHHRLIDTLRILPTPASDPEGDMTPVPQLGVEEGGLRSAEALLLARYFMFTQIYLHAVRRSYDIHLKDFLHEWLPDNKFSTDLQKHIVLTDTEVQAAMNEAARDQNLPGHDPASRITNRRHFKVVWQLNPGDIDINSEAGAVIAKAIGEEFGQGAVRRDHYVSKSSRAAAHYPVLQPDGRTGWSDALSSVLAHIPPPAVDFVFVSPEVIGNGRQWLKLNRKRLLEENLPKEDG